MAPLGQTLRRINQSTFKLDMSGVVGLFGGDNAIEALETIHLYAGRRWAGWYNYPGTMSVAKKFGRMADSRFWDSIFPGSNDPPALTFNLAGKVGPEYKGSLSGTKLPTGYLGYLVARESAGSKSELVQLSKDGTKRKKTGSPAAVTLISLSPRQHSGLISVIPKCDPPLAFWAFVPSLVSILTSIFCFLTRDWLCASLILFGIVSSGFSSLVLGTATLRIRAPVPSEKSPRGDGLMFPVNGDIIVLRGEEAVVNLVTKGEFELDYSAGILPHAKHHTIGFVSLLLMTQFLVQLLLIPRCTFFGQILFLISFLASGVYHLYVVSHEREKVHREILFRELSPEMKKWTLQTRTQVAVFACLVLGDGHPDPLKLKPNEILASIIPNDTAVWRYWRKKVVRELEHIWNWKTESGNLSYEPKIVAVVEDDTETDEYSQFTEQDTGLLGHLIDDAWCVFDRYSESKLGDAESAIKRKREGPVSLEAHPFLQNGSVSA